MPGPRPVKQNARSIIFTVFGDFLAGERSELPASSLVALMAEFGLSSQTVRQALSRLCRERWLTVRKHGKRAYYALTPMGKERVATLAPRIYGPQTEWDGRWRILTYTVAEKSRARRDALRKELAVLGWAPLSTSTWISPSADLGEAAKAAQNAGLRRELDLFAGEYRGPASDRDLLERCWDLRDIAAHYQSFIKRYEPRLKAERSHRKLRENEAFVERVHLVHEYRRFAYIDPGLPSALLPAHWPGTIASAIFREYYGLLDEKAERFFRGC